MQAGERIRSEPPSTISEACFGFIILVYADRVLQELSGLPRKTRWEKMVGNIDPGSGRGFIEINDPAPTDVKVGTIQHSC